ncbi:DUF418 domain-containing protein [Oceanobacillus luteolus]|uniref:DUF418 domain-containing protein n=1 Tax=Oceanobacillus luteolus TaxID=1274358 RepID=A0ABW4HQS0_9BACI|nr:DUF418 domain-containing protein [Oceanobacillus luteolus]MCM3741080.1 DUF418 domain-containing protein [Oceanobacillus luteolus]
MHGQLKPTSDQNRINHIDMIRGFAILGIFMVNIGAFSAPYFLRGGAEEAWNSPLDQFTLAFIDIFFQGSFYTLFSILFGFSWQLMKDRLQLKGMKYSSFLFRRQVVLIGFGLVHAILIWHGDILFSYGLIGLLLLLFLEVKDRTLLIWAAILFGGSVGIITLLLYPVRHLMNWTDQEGIRVAIHNYSSGSFPLIWQQNLQDWLMANSGITFILLCFILLPLFLFGMYLARKRWFHKPEEFQKVLSRLLVITFILSVILKFGPYLFGNPLWLTYVQDNFGGAASALFYMTLITLGAQTDIGMKIFRPLQYVGRMALSNYILQSVVCFLLFYGVGLGLYHSVTPAVSVLIALIIFGLQIILSKWWLLRFRFGPLEWVWRSLNYKQRQALRK